MKLFSFTKVYLELMEQIYIIGNGRLSRLHASHYSSRSFLNREALLHTLPSTIMFSLRSIFVALCVSSLTLAHPVITTSVDNSIEATSDLSLILSNIALLDDPEDKKVVSCLRAIDNYHYDISSWEQAWNNAQGDGIHKDECIYTREPTPQYYSIQASRETNGMYHVRVLRGDTVLKAVDVPTCPKHIQPPPTMGRFIWYLEKAYENAVPPYSC